MHMPCGWKIKVTSSPKKCRARRVDLLQSISSNFGVGALQHQPSAGVAGSPGESIAENPWQLILQPSPPATVGWIDFSSGEPRLGMNECPSSAELDEPSLDVQHDLGRVGLGLKLDDLPAFFRIDGGETARVVISLIQWEVGRYGLLLVVIP